MVDIRDTGPYGQRGDGPRGREGVGAWEDDGGAVADPVEVSVEADPAVEAGSVEADPVEVSVEADPAVEAGSVEAGSVEARERTGPDGPPAVLDVRESRRARRVRRTEHVAVITGANHGIGAAIARALAARGCAVLCTYLRLHDPVSPTVPLEYRRNRARDAEHVVSAIEDAGGVGASFEVDLSEPTSAMEIFEAAEELLGPVDILVNNATGWVQDTFVPRAGDRYGRGLNPVTAQTWVQQFTVDAMAPALLITEFARRHVQRGASWGRIVGLTSGGDLGFPEEVSYGAAKAAQTNYTMSAAFELAHHGITANMVHPPVTDTGCVTDPVREFVETSRTHFHVASPQEVAGVVAWLASDDARLVTGNVIVLR